MKKQITIARLIMLVGGAITILFSFFNFYKASFGDQGFSAWSGDLLFPESIIPVILAAAMVAYVVVELLGVKLPEQVLTFNWKQINVTWGIAAAGIMIGWLFTGQDGTDKGIGLIFMLIGSLAMGVGSVMNLLGMGANMVNLPQSSSSPASPTPGPMTTSAPPPPPPGAGGPPPPPPPPR